MKVLKHGPNMTELVYTDGTRVLVSYKTPVAAFCPKRGWIRSEQFFLRTMSKHAAKWLKGVESLKVPQSVITDLVEQR